MLIRFSIGVCLLLAVIYGAPLPSSSPTTTSVTSGNSTSEPATEKPHDVNYETLGGAYEGDMIFPNGFDPKKLTDARAVAIAGPHKWPNGVIPYDISAITDSNNRNLIKSAMQTLMSAVATSAHPKCITFREKTASDKDFVRIVYGDGCSSNVGYTSGQKSTLTLAQKGCFYTGTIQHELIHALGFYHEQSRPDRDNYITVNYQNIDESMKHNFNKYQWGTEVLNQNKPYDYKSVMHYPTNAFSKNGQPTITTKQSAKIGQRDGASQVDIEEIRQYYGC